MRLSVLEIDILRSISRGKISSVSPAQRVRLELLRFDSGDADGAEADVLWRALRSPPTHRRPRGSLSAGASGRCQRLQGCCRSNIERFRVVNSRSGKATKTVLGS